MRVLAFLVEREGMLTLALDSPRVEAASAQRDTSFYRGLQALISLCPRSLSFIPQQ